MAARDLSSCWNCGYDLSGVDSPVCPECGERIAAGGPFFEALLKRTRGTGRRQCAVCKAVDQWTEGVCPKCGSHIGTPVGDGDDPSPGKPDASGGAN